MGKDKVFRIKDEVGPDYKCSKCEATGFRLWRDSHIMLDCVELYCAECATAAQRVKIEQYKRHGIGHRVTWTIGDLLPARPTPEGDTFWGHSSGDTTWWYKLRHFKEPMQELIQVSLERDQFAHDAEHYAGKYLEADKARYEAERDCKEALRFAKLEAYIK